MENLTITLTLTEETVNALAAKLATQAAALTDAVYSIEGQAGETEQYMTFLLTKDANAYLKSQGFKMYCAQLQPKVSRLTTKDAKLATQTREEVAKIAASITSPAQRKQVIEEIESRMIGETIGRAERMARMEALESIFAQVWNVKPATQTQTVAPGTVVAAPAK